MRKQKQFLLYTVIFFVSCISTLLHSEKSTYFSEIDPRRGPPFPWQQTLEISKELYSGKTQFQDVTIFENSSMGRVLTLDGIVQTTEADEFIYHEMLVQVPMLTHPNPKNVLIIGGGDGGSLREVVRHSSVESVTMIDIDGQVVELCKKYLPQHSNGAFDDPRVNLLIQDGTEFVKNTQEKFDVIICDTTDPIGPGAVLFSTEFYANCKRVLNSGGIISTQSGVPFSDSYVVTNGYNNLTPSFQNVSFYVAPIPTYIGGFMTFSFSTDDPSYARITSKTLSKRLKNVTGKFKYYTPEIHKAAFALPQYIIDAIPKN